MKFLSSELLCCPIDELLLKQDNMRLLCAAGHSFDVARQGYVNLLGPGDKRSRDPGDSKAMVSARAAFLDSGHYEPIALQMAELVRSLVGVDATIVDAGCGEGYYLQTLRARLASGDHGYPTLIGFDISKWAVQAAARRFPATWIVASNRNIPLAAESADCLLSLFGFPVYASFHTLLKAGGTVLLVNAGPRHLIELREILYPSVRHSASTVVAQAQAAGLLPGDCSTLQYQTAPLQQPQLQQLLSMTPHMFRASREGKQRAAQINQLSVTIDVIFQLLHKVPTLHRERHTYPDSA